MKRRRWLFIAIAAVVAAAFLFWLFWPTVKWYGFTPKEERELSENSSQFIKAYGLEKADKTVDELVALGPDTLLPTEYAYLIPIVRPRYTGPVKEPVSVWRVRDILQIYNTRGDLISDIVAYHRSRMYGLKDLHSAALRLDGKEGGISIRLLLDYDAIERMTGEKLTDAEKRDAMAAAIKVLRSRVDRFIFSPYAPDRDRVTAALKALRSRIIHFFAPGYSVSNTDMEQIMLEIRSTQDFDSLRDSVLRVVLLSFQIVDDEHVQRLAEYMGKAQRSISEIFNSAGEVTDTNVTQLIPAGEKLLGAYKKDTYGIDELVGYTVVNGEAVLNGMDIKRFQKDRDQVSGSYGINLVLTERAAEAFYTFTGENIGKTLALVADDKVRFQARISQPIRDQVRVGPCSENEAEDLVILLREASIPVPFRIIDAYGVAYGFNFGVGFRAGMSMQFQIAPVGFALQYHGPYNAEVSVPTGEQSLTSQGDFIVWITDPRTGIKQPYPFRFSDFKSIRELADAIAKIPGVTVEPTGDMNASPSRILPPVGPGNITGKSRIINLQPAPGRGPAVDIAEIRAILSSMGQAELLAVGNPDDQRFIARFEAKTQDPNFPKAAEDKVKELLAAKYGADQVLIIK
jgi:hypothetical protein